MKYTIIEDCSPYYIRFTFDSLGSIIDYVSEITPIHTAQYQMYSHETLDVDSAKNIINMLSMADTIDFNSNRVAIFNTPPGGGCGIHKDGRDHRVSFNIPIEVADNNCITNWYEDEKFRGMPVLGNPSYTRNVYFDYKTMDKFTPAKTMVAQNNEMILFNTDIYHSWNNANSVNNRKVLTLRSNNPGSVFFEDVRKVLFMGV